MCEQPSARIYPVSLLLANRSCVVVGGGPVAERKVQSLLAAEANVTLVSPEATSLLHQLAGESRILWKERSFQQDDVSGARLVIAATNLQEVNRRVLECCARSGILASSVDGSWPEGDFISPAVVRHGDWTVAVSSGGSDPAKVKALAARLRHWLAEGAEDSGAGEG